MPLTRPAFACRRRLVAVAALASVFVLAIASGASAADLSAPPEPGGDTTVVAPNGAPIAVNEDSPEPEWPNIKLVVPVLEGGVPAPSEIRVISVTGGTLWNGDGGTIVLGAAGTRIGLVGGAAELRFRPESDRDTDATFSYVVVSGEDPTVNSAPSTATVTIAAVNDPPVLKTLSVSGEGLAGTYYRHNWDLTGPTTSRIDPIIDFWSFIGGSGVVVWGVSDMNAEVFSARWTGELRAPVSGTYQFSTVSDDGIRLWVDGQSLIDNWTVHPPTENWGPQIELEAGHHYDIRLEFYERGGGEVISLRWLHPGIDAVEVVPTAALFPAFVRPPLVYRLTDGVVPIDDRLAPADVDSPTLPSATVAITTGYKEGEDLLALPAQAGLSATFDAPTGVLTITGDATVAAYTDALRAVTYDNLAAPRTYDTRTVTFRVTDGENASNVTTRNIVVLPPAPDGGVVTLSGSASQSKPLTAVPSAFTHGPHTYVYVWLRCDAAGADCEPIAGATGAAYIPTEEDFGSTLRAQIVASGPGGDSEPVRSAASSIVTGAGALGPFWSGEEGSRAPLTAFLADGTALLVYTRDDSVWARERPRGGSWSEPVEIFALEGGWLEWSGSRLHTNAAGEALLGSSYYNSALHALAASRNAAGDWSTQVLAADITWSDRPVTSGLADDGSAAVGFVSEGQLQVAVREAGEATFGAPVPHGPADTNAVAVGADGTIVALGGGSGSMLIDRRDAAGHEWTTSYVSTGWVYSASASVAPDGSALVAYMDDYRLFALTGDAAGAWADPVAVFTDDHQVWETAVSIADDGSGVVASIGAKAPSWITQVWTVAYDPEDGFSQAESLTDGRDLNAHDVRAAGNGLGEALVSWVEQSAVAGWNEGVGIAFRRATGNWDASRLIAYPATHMAPALDDDGLGLVGWTKQDDPSRIQTTFLTQRPTNLDLPEVWGDALDDSTLTGSLGDWRASGEVQYVREWLRCDADGKNCTPTGQTGEEYLVGPADARLTIRLRITATNDGGPTIAVSAATALVPGGGSGCTITGTGGDDVLVGTPGPDVICGLAGDDVLRGLDGNDVLLGGAGIDVLRGGLGNDQLKGGPDDDVLRGGAGNDRLKGGAGNDVLRGGGGDDVLVGWSGNDGLFGGSGNDRLFGGLGGDVLAGGSGRDLLFGEAGHDRLTGGFGPDGLDGGAGHDRLFGENGDDVLSGGPGDDLVVGGTGHDALLGGSGADRLLAYDGIRDFVDGGTGQDTAFVDGLDRIARIMRQL